MSNTTNKDTADYDLPPWLVKAKHEGVIVTRKNAEFDPQYLADSIASLSAGRPSYSKELIEDVIQRINEKGYKIVKA